MISKVAAGLKFALGTNGCTVFEVQVPSPASDCKRVHVGDKLLQIDGQFIVGKDACEIQVTEA